MLDADKYSVPDTIAQIVSSQPDDSSKNVELLENYLREHEERNQWKQNLRQANSAAFHHSDTNPDEHKHLESNLKRNTAFVRRVRSFAESQLDHMLADLRVLNLSKYTSEIAIAITEAKLKMCDVQAIVTLCSHLHRVYADFSACMLSACQRVLACRRDQQLDNASKFRVDLRVFVELVSVEALPRKESLAFLSGVLSTLVALCRSFQHCYCSILISFCRYFGEEFAGLVPASVARAAQLQPDIQLPVTDTITCEKKRNVCQLFVDYFRTLCDFVLDKYSIYLRIRRANRNTLLSRGEVSVEMQNKLSESEITYQKLWDTVAQMAELINCPLPVLPDDKDENEEKQILAAATSEGILESVWEDEDQCNFYTNLRDLRATLPSILYADSQADKSTICENAIDEVDEEDDLEEPADEMMDDSDETRESNGTGETTAATLHTVDPNTSHVTNHTSSDNICVAADESTPPKEDTCAVNSRDDTAQSCNGHVSTSDKMTAECDNHASVSPVTTSPSSPRPTPQSQQTISTDMQAFLASLSNCISRSHIDDAAERFCVQLNTRSNRRKLVTALFTVPRTRLDLLPFYARLIATLSPCMPAMAKSLVQSLRNEFKRHVSKRDQTNIESKLKTMRFIGELVKFGVYPAADALWLVRTLLNHFTHHHVSMSCALLESCGRFLYRSGDTHVRMKSYLDNIMRKRSALQYDAHYLTAIDNVYYSMVSEALSESSSAVQQAPLPPLHAYIEHLLFSTLDTGNVSHVARQIRKLDWTLYAETMFACQNCTEEVCDNFTPQTAGVCDPSEIRPQEGVAADNGEKCGNERREAEAEGAGLDACEHCIACLSTSWRYVYPRGLRQLTKLLAILTEYHSVVRVRVLDNVLEDIRLSLEICHRSPHWAQRSISQIFYLCEMYNYRLVRTDTMMRMMYSLATYGVGVQPATGDTDVQCAHALFCCEPAGSEVRLRMLCSLISLRSLSAGSLRVQRQLRQYLVYAQLYYWLRRERVYELRSLPFPLHAEQLFQDAVASSKCDMAVATSLQEAQTAVAQLHEQLCNDGQSENEVEQDEEIGGKCGVANNERGDADPDRGGQRRAGRDAPVCDDEDEERCGPTSPDISSETHGTPEEEEDEEEEEDSVDGSVEDSVEDDGEVCDGLHSQEDELFRYGLERLIVDSINERSREVGAPSACQLAPLVLDPTLAGGEQTDSETMRFTLVTRKGNKPQQRAVRIPLDSELVRNLRVQQDIKRREHEKIKQLTLSMSEMQQLEQAACEEQLNHSAGTVNRNRERHWNRNHYSRTVPDPDTIFGGGSYNNRRAYYN